MHVTDDFTEQQIVDLAMSAVAKISLQGMRGATLCSQQETVAMAALIVRLASQSIPTEENKHV